MQFRIPFGWAEISFLSLCIQNDFIDLSICQKGIKPISKGFFMFFY